MVKSTSSVFVAALLVAPALATMTWDNPSLYERELEQDLYGRDLASTGAKLGSAGLKFFSKHHKKVKKVAKVADYSENRRRELEDLYVRTQPGEHHHEHQNHEHNREHNHNHPHSSSHPHSHRQQSVSEGEPTGQTSGVSRRELEDLYVRTQPGEHHHEHQNHEHSREHNHNHPHSSSHPHPHRQQSVSDSESTGQTSGVSRRELEQTSTHTGHVDHQSPGHTGHHAHAHVHPTPQDFKRTMDRITSLIHKKQAQKAPETGSQSGLDKRDLEDLNEILAREYDDLYERDLDEDLYERDFDEDLYVRDLEEDFYERDLEEDLYERDLEEDLYEREFEDEWFAREFYDLEELD